MKRILAGMLAICCMLLGGCSIFKEETVSGVYAPEINPDPATDTINAVLYFPMRGQDYLATEKRQVKIAAGESSEAALISELISGPDSESQLENAFWSGVTLARVNVENQAISVVLSAEFLMDMGQDAEAFRKKQRMALYSIVNTLTENERDRYAQVQFYIDRNGTARRASREEMGFTDANPGEALEPLSRNNTLILTPRKVAEIVLQAAVDKDASKMIAMLAEDGMPAQEELTELMMTAGSVIEAFSIRDEREETTPTGEQRAVVVVDVSMQKEQTLTQKYGVQVSLVSEGDVWKVDYSSIANELFVQE